VPLPGISLARQQNIFDFIQRIEHLRRQLDPLALPDQLRYLVRQTPLGTRFDEVDEAPHALSLLMRRAAAVRDRRAFLESLALIRDSDSYDPRAERVTLLTLHAAKGLEFPVVFIAGCEDGFLPFRRHLEAATSETSLEALDLNEEGRLLYVGMTRARQLLFLSRAQKRRIYGKMQVREPSPFLAAIDKDLLTVWDQKTPKKAPPRQLQLGLFD
jgi:superfamily I DNA/RNA helicase